MRWAALSSIEIHSPQILLLRLVLSFFLLILFFFFLLSLFACFLACFEIGSPYSLNWPRVFLIFLPQLPEEVEMCQGYDGVLKYDLEGFDLEVYMTLRFYKTGLPLPLLPSSGGLHGGPQRNQMFKSLLEPWVRGAGRFLPSAPQPLCNSLFSLAFDLFVVFPFTSRGNANCQFQKSRWQSI